MNITPESKTVEEMFISGSFVIPLFQRPFSWEPENISELLADIRDTGVDDHFLGPIVVITRDGYSHQDLVDGQQRLTMLQICLSIIRDRHTSLGNSVKAALVGSLVRDDDTGKPRLTLGKANKAFFDKYVATPQDITSHVLIGARTKPAGIDSKEWKDNKKLAKAYSQVAEEVRDMNDEELEQFSVAIRKQLRFVRVAVTDLGDAFQLFETLNSRGLELSAADLLKNFVLEKRALEVAGSPNGEQSLGELATEWAQIVSDVGESAMNSQFVRYYLLMTHEKEKVQKKHIYKYFREVVDDRSADEALHDLRLKARSFVQAGNPALIEPSGRRRKLEKKLNDINDVGVQTAKIALMAMLTYVHDDDLAGEIASTIESLVLRWTVCGQNAQVLESHFAAFAKAVHRSAGQQAGAALRDLKRHIPKDTLFKEYFIAQSGGRQSRIRYVLRKLERAMNAQDAADALTIEHIAPQTATDYWKTKVQGDYDETIQRWGNLTLLAKELNSEAQNSPWPQKLSIYSKDENSRYQVGSQIAITSPLLNVEEWDEGAINARQKWMAELAIQIWPEDGSAKSAVQIPALKVGG